MSPGVLEKKLAEVQSHQSRKKKIFGYSVLAIFAVLFVVAFVYLAIQLDRARPQLLEFLGLADISWQLDRARPQLQQAEESSPQRPAADVGDTTGLPPDNVTEATQPTESPAAGTDTTAFRQQFMQQLAQYENEVEPKIDEIRLQYWDAKTHTELADLKARAIELFSKGEYLLAREGLQQARTMAAEASAEYVSRLATAKREAKEAFENNRAPEAEKAIQQALRMSPADSEMLALQKRVEVMPQVLDLLRQAGVAENENRPEKEVVALQKVLSIDPSRGQIKSRLEKLRTQLRQQQFSSALSKAQNALDAGNLADAKKQIALAKTILPASKALGPLQNRLQQAQTEREFAEQMSLGEQAVQRDDWPAAAKSFGRARKVKPNAKTATDNYHAVQKVVKITQKISGMLAREQRLGDKNILDSVAAYLREVKPVVGASPRLQKIHVELTRKVDLYKTEVDVVVVSDNKTYIVVRGEGQVGKTARRTIRLRPGKRVFEGSRSGYKSKLVTLDIVPGTPSLEVTIVCDEKI